MTEKLPDEVRKRIDEMTEEHRRHLTNMWRWGNRGEEGQAPKIAEMDPMFSRYYEEKILNALLNACALALDADSGSVMTLDKKTNSLHIKVSQKLDKEIVDNTEVKIGEGIAGIVAATAQPLILPKDKDKEGLGDKLKRKNIKSSMVVPLGKVSKENVKDLYGVINLNVARKEKDFSAKDTAIVQELTNLASIALAGIQHADTNGALPPDVPVEDTPEE